MEGLRAVGKDDGGEEKGGRAWWEGRKDRSGETGRLTQSHSCRPDL